MRSSNFNLNVIAVNGCCYGRDNKDKNGQYLKYCGQAFWEFISGDKDLYANLIEPIGKKAKERNDEFMQEYAAVINNFSYEFMKDFCLDGRINWQKLVEFNSSN